MIKVSLSTDHFVAMVQSEQNYVLCLTRDEAWELFARCMNSSEPDNDLSNAVLHKLAQLMESTEPPQALAG